MIEDRQILYNLLPISLEGFKQHISITTSDLDAKLRNVLDAAIRTAESSIGRVIAQSRFVYSFDFKEQIILPKYPVIEVEQVLVDGVVCSTYTRSGRAIFLNGISGSGVTVTFIAGEKYIAPDIRLAVYMTAAYSFAHPMDEVHTLPTAAELILRRYRKWGDDRDEQ